MRALRAVAAVVVFLSAGCNCDKPTGTDDLKPDDQKPALDLKPLPKAPDIQAVQEPLPGAEALAVVVARPQGKAMGEVRPTVTFNKPVKSLMQVEEQRASDKAAPFADIQPPLEGEWRWLGSASAEFVPSKLVPLSNHFAVTIKKGLKALDGTSLESDYVFAFDTPPLELQDVGPYKSFRWLKPDDEIRLLFNQPVASSDLEAKLTLKVEGEAQPWKVKVKSKKSIQEEKRELAEAAKKEGRRPAYDDDRMSDDARGYRNQQTRYVLVPEKKFPLEKAVKLEIAPDLHGEQGPAPIAKVDLIGWDTYGPLKVSSMTFCEYGGGCAYGPLVLETTNEVELESLKTRVKVTPAVELDWENARTWAPSGQYDSGRGPRAIIPGKFKPGTKYEIEVAAGVTDVFKQATSAASTESLRTNDLNPAIVTGPYLGLIEASNDTPPRLPLEVSNLKSIDVQLWNLTDPTEIALALLDKPRAQYLKRDANFTETQALKYPKNVARVHPIELSKAFGEKKTGIALVNVKNRDVQYAPKEGWTLLAQVTDLAAHVKVGPKKSVVWVTRLSTGAPVEGADVSLYDDTGASKWSGQTDKDGLADVPGAVDLKLKGPEYEWQYPQVVVLAQKDGDVSGTANTWATGVEPYEFGLTQGWEGEAPQTASFMFTDRGIYRPGDTVHIKGVVRYRTVGELKMPSAKSTFAITVTDSRDQQLKTGNVTVTKYGTFSFEAKVGKDAPTGYYAISASAQGVELNGSFRVAEYRAPQFKVDVETKKPSYVHGEALEAKVLARYLFGGAMADAKTKWSVNRFSTTFTTPEAPDYTFAQETWWWDDRGPEEAGGFFASGDGRVDVKGELPIVPGKVEAPGEKPWTYTVEGEVEDVNRQTVAGRRELTVHPASAYVGLRASTGFMQAGTEYALDTVVVDTDGKRVKGKKVNVTVNARVWKSVKKKDATGGFSTVSEPEEKQVHQCALESAADGAVPCKFKPTEAGFYIVKAQVEDESARKHSASLGVYVTGSGFVAWQRNDTDRIELVLDKAKYDVGDVAKVLIKSPYARANALLTVEREGVLMRKPLKLEGSVTAVEIPVTEDMVPNVFAGVVLMQPRVAKGGIESGDDPGRPNARIGLVKLSVEKKTKRLSVKVSTDKPQYQPGQEVKVTVDVADSRGAGADGEVTLYAVDEAVLMLTGYETPDPINAIFPERPLSVRIGEPLLHLVRKRSYGEKGEAQGGGGGREGSGFRQNFKTTALWAPTVEARNGKATATFKLPDNLTTFRIMAVVITEKERFGSGEAKILVNKPVLVMPALPRFARVGDTFEAGVVVHAYGSGSGEVAVTAAVEGAAALSGPAEQKVQVSETAPREVRFVFKAERPGTATFRFKAVKGDDNDGVEEKLPVELPVALEAVATYGDTEAKSVEGVAPPKDVWGDLGGLSVTMSSTSLGNFSQGFQQLIEYPYGCLEQQSSRLVPFIALREIAGQFKVPWPAPDKKKAAADNELNAWLNTYLFPTLDVSKVRDPDEVIAETVKSIGTLQDDDGSFKYWPTSWCSSSWTSAWATLSLHRAREVGFTVPAKQLAKAEAYLGKVAGGTCQPCERGCDDETRVMAAYVLARMGKPKASAYGELYGRKDKLSLFSRTLLANAMFVGGGDKKQASALLQEVLNFAKESPKGVHIEEASSATYATYFHSDTRTTGALLQALTDIQPAHPFVGKLSRYLLGVRQGDGEWRTTQEAAWTLMGLTEVVRTKEKDTPEYQAVVSLGDAKLFEQKFSGRSMTVEKRELPMKDLLAKAGGSEQKLTFSKEGTGVLYYSALLQYAPKALPMTALDNGLVVQRWFEPYAGGGQATKFYAGDLVRVRVRVASNQERHWAAFEVPLPAGLEPVDTSLATTGRNTSSPNEERRDVGYEGEGAEDGEEGGAYEGDGVGPWAYSFWSPFNHIEQRDSRVVLFADHLPPGVHVSSFVARATTPGTYLMKPARGELMYEPEVWGRSEGGSFEVAVPVPVTAR
ncbi:MAG: alpha-2-macroglobulin [Myxococcaceae bacterium]|nr:alpha-2-macroglobulin [Myxococcaceae bacterium]